MKMKRKKSKNVMLGYVQLDSQLIQVKRFLWLNCWWCWNENEKMEEWENCADMMLWGTISFVQSYQLHNLGANRNVSQYNSFLRFYNLNSVALRRKNEVIPENVKLWIVKSLNRNSVSKFSYAQRDLLAKDNEKVSFTDHSTFKRLNHHR